MPEGALERRQFLRKAAASGMALAWVAPLVQTIAATPAYAQAQASPQSDGPCFKSTPNRRGQSCMSACVSACERAGFTAKRSGEACNGMDADPCNPHYGGQGPCQHFCPSGQGGDNPCCNEGLCDPRNFTCERVGRCVIATYHGDLTGCV